SCLSPSSSHLLFFFVHVSGAHRDLHSFPTRRSSDLRRSACSYVFPIPPLQFAGVPAAFCEIDGTAECVEEASVLDGTCTRIGSRDRKSTRLNSSHVKISYAVFCLKKKKNQ